MYNISLNIGYGDRSLHPYPSFYQFENMRQFSDMVRRDAFQLVLYGHNNGVGISRIALYIHIDTEDKEWDFTIMCKNIREYKQYLNLDETEIERLKVELNRDSMIDEILEG